MGLLNMIKNSTSGAGTGKSAGSVSGGQPQAGFRLVSFTNITLGSSTTPFGQTNIKPPNGYALSNLMLKLVVKDTTGTSVPSGVNSIESALSTLNIIGSSGRPIMPFKPTTGDTTKWQNILNDNYAYSTAPTPADSSASTAYTVTWTPRYKHLVIDSSELANGFEISGNANTVSSRATTTNGMTSEITELSVYADFVPVSGYTRTQYRTKNFSTSTTSAYIQLGNQLDNAVNSVLAADFGTDSILSDSQTFYLAQNGNTLIPYTSYDSITAILDSYPNNGNSAHISGFFPMQTLYQASVNSNQSVVWEANIGSTAPSGGGITDNVVIYQAEQY